MANKYDITVSLFDLNPIFEQRLSDVSPHEGML